MKPLSVLNPVESDDLRQLILIGKIPRIPTLAKFVQLGFLEPGTFEIRPGVREAVLSEKALKDGGVIL